MAQVSDVEVCCWAYEGQTHRLRTALADDVKLLQKRDSHHRTALHWACASGKTEIVRMLLKLGSEVMCIQCIIMSFYMWMCVRVYTCILELYALDSVWFR